MNCRQILCIEGIPGSGKSTLAENLNKRCIEAGIDSYWILEEDKKHPITPSTFRAKSLDEDFPSLCLNSWQNFANALKITAILDGCALQSTVRFLFANDISETKISDYWKRWEATLENTPTKMIYIAVTDPPSDMRERVFPLRGNNWTELLVHYVENTQLGKRLGLTGTDGLVTFWAMYQEVCLALITEMSAPTLMIELSSDDPTNIYDHVFRWIHNYNA